MQSDIIKKANGIKFLNDKHKWILEQNMTIMWNLLKMFSFAYCIDKHDPL